MCINPAHLKEGTAALHFENLARLFRNVKSNPSQMVYFIDEGMEDV
jgi:hypothetical protein